MSEYIVWMPSNMPYEIKAELNAWYVESGPIVRCRDCKHFNDYHGKCHRQSGVLIDDYSTRRLEDLGDVLVLADAEPDGFCKWGERES